MPRNCWLAPPSLPYLRPIEKRSASPPIPGVPVAGTRHATTRCVCCLCHAPSFESPPPAAQMNDSSPPCRILARPRFRPRCLAAAGTRCAWLAMATGRLVSRLWGHAPNLPVQALDASALSPPFLPCTSLPPSNPPHQSCPPHRGRIHAFNHPAVPPAMLSSFRLLSSFLLFNLFCAPLCVPLLALCCTSQLAGLLFALPCYCSPGCPFCPACTGR